MTRILGFYESTLGKKWLMASTGIILFLFVVVHMLGNLQLYLGAEQLNHYAELLRKNPALLWIARSVLLFCVTIHIIAAVQVWLRSRASRPVKYRVFRPPAVDYAARTMAWSGPIIAAFVVFHILDLTLGTVHPGFIPGDVFNNVVTGFQNPWVAGFYILANFLLADSFKAQMTDIVIDSLAYLRLKNEVAGWHRLVPPGSGGPLFQQLLSAPGSLAARIPGARAGQSE